jgi:hypothetical protein
VYGYNTKNTTAKGSNATHNGFNCHAENVNTANDTTASSTPSSGLTAPLGTCRMAVRGLRASIAASITRFNAIALVRAPAIANEIHNTVMNPGHHVPSSCLDANNIPAYANGNAKIVCSNLTNSR